MNKNIIWSLFLLLSILTSCNEDDSFAGNDNYITTFPLTQGEQTISATFQGDTIHMLIPEGFLGGHEITPKVICSENSTLTPAPESISAWGEEQNFFVTSYNGSKRRYHYIPVQGDLSESGLVILNTQADVEAFGAKGLTRLEGNLVIGRTIGSDTITSLEPLAALRSVSGNVTLNKTCKPYYITGLDNLQEIGGSFEINAVDSIWTVIMPRLEKIGNDLYIKSGSANDLTFPVLASVGGNMTLASAFAHADFSSLQRVGADLALNGTVVIDDQSFQSLNYVNGAIKVGMNVNKLRLPELEQCGGLEITSKTVQLLYTPRLQRIVGTLSTVDSPTYEFSFPELKQAGTISINSPKVNQANFSKLEVVEGNFDINLLGFDLNKLAALQRIGGKATFNFKKEEVLQFPSSLKEIGELMVSTGYYKTLNLKNIQVNRLTISGNSDFTDMKIIADDVFKGELSFSSMWNASTQLPQMEGFKEVAGLTLNATFDISILSERITRINGDFVYNSSNFTELPMNKLEEVTGNFYIYETSYGAKAQFYFPVLKNIGGNARISIYTDYAGTEFPALETIGGNFALHTGFGTYGPATILYPSLKKVGGTLGLYPQGYANDTQNIDVSANNNVRADLDFLSGLESIGGFKAINHKALYSYEGLKKAIATCPADKWDVTGNLYNPSYEDLTKKNQWIQPEE